MYMNIKNNHPLALQLTEQMNIQRQNKRGSINTQSHIAATDFHSILEKRQEVHSNGNLRFSKHANERLVSRNIDLSHAQLERLEQGTKKASEKGINESLVMIDNLAFIVNVKNNTVVTAVNDTDDKVFTNIDGAVIN